MPWNTVTLMEEINRFVCLAATGRFTVTELCTDFHVSRKTGYKWLRRYQAEGARGLRPFHSAAPRSAPSGGSAPVFPATRGARIGPRHGGSGREARSGGDAERRTRPSVRARAASSPP